MPSTSFSMRMDDDLRAAIEEEARRNDVSAAQVVTRAVRLHVQAREAERAAVEAALIEADKGEFISSEAMLAWVNSWGTSEELPMPKPDIQK